MKSVTKLLLLMSLLSILGCGKNGSVSGDQPVSEGQAFLTKFYYTASKKFYCFLRSSGTNQAYSYIAE